MGAVTDEGMDPRIGDMVRRIVMRFRPEKVILFGSRAAGRADADSDVDLLVVLRVEGSVRKKAMEIDLALADRTLPLDLIVVTPEQFERERESIGSVVRPAAREGKVLYDRAA